MASPEPHPSQTLPTSVPERTWLYVRLRVVTPMESPAGRPPDPTGVAVAILLGSIGWCQVSNTAW